MEQCDWIPALITVTDDVRLIKLSRLASGHKAMWHPEWGGLPSEGFLVRLDSLLKGFRERLYTKTYASEFEAGTISRGWSKRLELPENVKIGVGAIDAHFS